MTILIRPFSDTPRFRARWAAVLLAPVAMAWLLVWGAVPAQATTQTFTYTGAEQTFVVPAGVFNLHVVAIGGSGGKATDAVGGVGAEATGGFSVIPGQTLYVEVGGRGQSIGEGGAGGFNGGGSGAGGGGGASDVRTSPLGAGLAPDHRLIVAAGGGGGGGSGEVGGTNGGAAGSPGVSGEYAGGGAGTESEGGAGAAGCEPSGGGTSGELGLGGIGGNSEIFSAPGGGGGGGYYGGGGGGGACHVGSSGGGGGSSLVPLGGSLVLASLATEPQIQLSYTLPPAEEKVAPNTVLGFHPQKKITTKKKKVKVKFTFSSNVTGATFKCKLDKGAFASCKSPKSYKVKPGKHKFSVEAVSAGGTDSSPAAFSFSVKKKH